MTDKFDIDSHRSWFHHLIWGSPNKAITELVHSEGYGVQPMTVELKINGKLLRYEDFNAVLTDWADRIEAQIKEELEYVKSEEASKEIARDMFYKAIDKLDWDR